MRVRALDSDGDWTFGQGQNNYKRDRAAVAQNIQTRLYSFLGNCFFDLGAGIDWFNYLSGKDPIGLNLAITSTILNTTGVTGIISSTFSIDPITREVTYSYQVNTIFGPIVDELVLPTNYLTTESGSPLITEDGENIIV